MKIEIADCGAEVTIRRTNVCLSCYRTKNNNCKCCRGTGTHSKKAKWEIEDDTDQD